RSADALRIVYARILVRGVLTQLAGAVFGELLHIRFRAEMKASRRARFDAGRLEPYVDAVRTERALEDFLRFRIELRDVERAAGQAILAADAILLMKIDDTVGVLHDGAVGGARAQASRIGAVHALILAHQPSERAVGKLVLVEADQVVIVPLR